MRNKSVLIYGVGQRFFDEFFYNYILSEVILTSKTVGICDKDREKARGINIPFVDIGDEIREYDEIVITSDRFFEEIKSELIRDFAIEEDKILSIEDVERYILREKLMADLFTGLSGVEIGGPSSIFKSNIYEEMGACDGVNFSKDTVWWNDSGRGYVIDDSKKGKVIIADAVELSQIEDGKYDFCISSNILEHVANPLKALFEMKRVIRKDGLLLTIVPNKDTCFDHNRAVTKFMHVLSDYKEDIAETDLTHLEEIALKHDYQMDIGVASKEEFIERAKNNYSNRCLHQHVFDEALLKELFRFIGVEIITSGKMYYNWYVIGKKVI